MAKQRRGETTRARLLDEGEALAREAFRTRKVDPVQLLNPAEIAERAGVTRGTLYHHWPASTREADDRLEAYRRELFQHLLALPFDPDGIGTEALKYAGQPFEEMVRGLAEFDFRRYSHGGESAEDFRFSTLMVIVAETMIESKDERNALSAEMRVRGAYGKLATIYTTLLGAYGREMIPGFQVEDLVEGLWSLLDGFTLNSWHFERLTTPRPGLSEGSGRDWSLFSISALAILEALTRPKQDPATGPAPPAPV